MPRFNITMPQELWDRVGQAAPEGNRSWFIRRALEEKLGAGTPKTGVGSFARQLAEGIAPGPASPRASTTTKAELDGLRNIAEGMHDGAAQRMEASAKRLRACEKCGKEFPSPSLRRCSACNGKILPEPA